MATESSSTGSDRIVALNVDAEEVGNTHQPELHTNPEHRNEKPGWKKVVAHIGPGFLISMAYIDPGSMETLFQTASNDKYELLWIILLGFILVFIVQSLAANIGVVTGMHLAEHIRMEYPKSVNYVLWILTESTVVGADIPEVIGTAFALNILFRIPIWVGVLVTGFTPFILLFVQRFGFRKLEMLLAVIILVIAACFIGELPYAKAKSTEVLRGLIPGFRGRSSAVGDAIAFLGALIMPHNLFIHSALVLTRRPPQSVKGINDACRYFMIESAPPLALAMFVNIVVIAVTGGICFATDILPNTSKLCSNLTLNNAAFLFKNVLGKWSKLVYGISLLASAQGSSLTVNCSGQYIMQGFLEKKIKRWVISIITRLFAMIPSLIVAIIGGSSGCAKLIIISSMVLSFQLPFTLLPLLRFTSSKKKMGPHTNTSMIVVAWILALCLTGINVHFLLTCFIHWLAHSYTSHFVKELVGIIVFPVMGLYLVGMVYLAFRKIQTQTYSVATQQSLPVKDNAEQSSINEVPYREDLLEMADSE